MKNYAILSRIVPQIICQKFKKEFENRPKTSTFKIDTFELFAGIGFLTKNRPYGRFCKSWLREMDFPRSTYTICRLRGNRDDLITFHLSNLLVVNQTTALYDTNHRPQKLNKKCTRYGAFFI